MLPNSIAGYFGPVFIGDRRQAAWLVVMATCVIGLTGINAYRAAVQSITHDEAVTYERYVRGPLYKIVTSTDANNHILHSLLCRATVGICGPSEFVLRLPSLMGGLFLLVMVGRVGWRVWGPSITTVVAVLLVGLNPFVMDYQSIARGYSLALALWVAALDQFLAACIGSNSWDISNAEDPNRQSSDRSSDKKNYSFTHQLPPSVDSHVRRSSQLLALSVLANLTFVLAAWALGACWACWAWQVRRRDVTETKRQTFQWFWQTLIRPGTIVFACLALPLVKLRPSHFYYGSQSFADSLCSFVNASFAHHPQNWPWDNQSAWFQHWLEIIALKILPIVIIALIVVWLYEARQLVNRSVGSSNRVGPGVMLFYFSAGTLFVVLGLLVVLHLSIGLKLPLERTGLYLVLPFYLAILTVGSTRLVSFRPTWQFSASVLQRAVTVGGLLLCIVWGGQLQWNHYRSWNYDRDSRSVFQQIVAMHQRAPKQQLRVGATWALAPALNFYRDVYQADYVERIGRSNQYPPDVDLFVVAGTEVGGVLPSEPVIEIYRGTDSGTIVAVPTRRMLSIPSDMTARMK
jgi:hypothetical protein